MGSGPIIISDDGSPPPGRPDGMRVSRKHEFMQNLEVQNGCHNLLDKASLIQHVFVNNTEVKISSINRIVVTAAPTGSGAPTSFTVSSGTGPVKVCTDNALVEDLRPAYGRYRAPEPSIASVSVNGTNVPIGPPNKNRVRIEVA